MSENSSTIIFMAIAIGLWFLLKGLKDAKTKGGAIDALKLKIHEQGTFMNMERSAFLTSLEEEPGRFDTNELVEHLLLLAESLTAAEQRQIKHILNQLNETGQRVFVKSIVE